MTIFRDRSVIKFATALMFFSCAEAQAMTWSCDNGNTEKSFDVKIPLSQWPIVNSLTTQQEQEVYRSTWDQEKPLEENQKWLVNLFMETCCDFSFKKRTEELKGITVGRLGSGEDIVFTKPGISINAHPNSAEVLIYNEREKFYGLKAYVTTNIFLNIEPLDLTEQMKKDFEKCVSELTKDPMGCEVLRVAISKYKGGTTELPKLTFIPVKNKDIGLAYTTDSNIWRYLKNTDKIHFNEYRKFFRSSKFIMFSPRWSSDQHSGLFLKLKPESSVEKPEFSLNTGIVPKEVIFLHQLIYSLNVEEDNIYKQTQLIEQRAGSGYFHGRFERLGNFLITNKQMNLSFLLNDNVCRTMYGLTKYGKDLINESSYLAKRYGIIRPMYLGINTKFKVNGEKLTPEESYILYSEFLKTNGDHDVYWHYLVEQEYPEFGQGNYRCSDISDKNIVTEERNSNYSEEV
ncbi:MAG: hypothetical protein J6T29_03530 [Alphaproteobacteria bacterium]|nr:hypothetical protein [Alphaproteobacteria bacterium]